MVRPAVAYALCQYGGFTQRQAADIMDLRSGAAVSLQIKRLHEQLLLNNKLRATLENIESQLENLNNKNSSS